MKALDTSVLLALLHGSKGSRELVHRLRGAEVATTELNLLELGALADRGPPRARGQRREAIDRLRRSLTVLPFDSKVADRLARKGRRGAIGGVAPLLQGALAILEANGCEELITLDPGAVVGKWQFRVTKFDGTLI
jgi:predicted nucleic acid-binding protein